MEFSVLGPVSVREGDREIGLAPRLRTLLAALVCHRGRVVSADRLIDVLWSEDPPESAARSLQVYVHRLRTALGTASAIEYRSPGYRLAVPDDRIDAGRFEGLAARGRARIADGDPVEGAELLRQALGLWRGDAFGDLTDLPHIREEAERLTELRYVCLEDRLRAELDLGRHTEAVGELRGLVSAHPYREGLRALLMLALYRLGRAPEALETYREGRTLMAAELGMEPGPALRDLERAILNQDPGLAAPPPPAARPAVPRELPADVTAFVGRDARADRLVAALTEGTDRPAGAAEGGGDRRAVPIAAIDGAAGAGKSALAIHVAHRVAAAYPDGQLYVNLHGHTAGRDPLAPGDVLDRFLRALGDRSQDITVEEAAARFRSLTSGRRILVVLDNAADAAQVRPLLPADPGCGVLVTGRRVLAVLDGATYEHLDALAPADAVTLLGRLVGADRTEADREAVAEIARLCGYWPLALRIAAARLVVRRDLSPAAFAARLAEDRGRLDELQHADLAVRASLAASHRNQPEEARMLAVLGVFNGHTVSVPVAAAATGTGEAETRAVLGKLVESQLLQAVGPGRYDMHDLVRAYAREQAELLLTPDERAATLHRVLHFYLATARRAAAIIETGATARTTVGAPADPDVRPPDLTDQAEAMHWIDGELDNLVDAVRLAGAGSHPAIAVGLAAALFLPLDIRSDRRRQTATTEIGLEAARRIGDVRGAAQLNNDRGVVCALDGRPDEAMPYLHDAINGWRLAGDRVGELKSINCLAVAHNAAGRLADAAEVTRRALELAREVGDDTSEAVITANLGYVYRRLGRMDEAMATCEDALVVSRKTSQVRAEVAALGTIGDVLRSRGRLDEAADTYRQGIELALAGGHQFAAAEYAWWLGEILDEMGDRAGARNQWTIAVTRLREIGVIDIDEAQDVLTAPDPPTPTAIRRHI